MTPAPAEQRRERLLSWLMLAVAGGSILVPLNSTMLAVALPGVMDEFGLGGDEVSSLVSLYLGAVAVTLPAAGALADRFGARRLFVAGVLGFGVASLVAAVGTSFVVLEAARVLQAASGALVSTSSAALIRVAAPRDRQGEAFGLFDLLVSTSAAVGPFVGGILVAAFGWRALFTLAVPIAVLAAISVLRLAEPAARAGAPGTTAAGPPRPVDVPGLALLAAVIVALLVGLRSAGTSVGWLALGAAAILLVAFVLLERRLDHPAVDLRLFGQPSFAAAVAGVLGSTAVLHGCFLLVPILVERLLAGTPTASGIVLLGIAGVSAIVAPWGGGASDRLGRRRLAVAGSVVTTVGLVAMATPAGIGSQAAVAVLLGVVGLGMGLAGSPRQAAALEAVGPERVGMAAGTYYTGRYLGGVVGASLGGAVLAGGVTGQAMATGFAVLAGISAAVAVASVGLPGRSADRAAAAARV